MDDDAPLSESDPLSEATPVSLIPGPYDDDEPIPMSISPTWSWSPEAVRDDELFAVIRHERLERVYHRRIVSEAAEENRAYRRLRLAKRRLRW